MAPTEILTVTREGRRLFVQLTGQLRLEVTAENGNTFAVNGIDAHITFAADGNGHPGHLVLDQNGRKHVAKRVQ